MSGFLLLNTVPMADAPVETTKLQVVDRNISFLEKRMEFDTLEQPYRNLVFVTATTKFKSTTRMYPLHRTKNGDMLDSFGMDDFMAELMEYEIFMDSQPCGKNAAGDDLYAHIIKAKGQTCQPMKDGLPAALKRALLRRVAMNLTAKLIHLGTYKDVEFDLPGGVED